MSAPRVILGIDPGFSALGWAALELRPPGPHLLALGLLRTRPGEAALLKSEDNLARLRVLWRGLHALAELRPVAIAAEAQSWPRNASAAAKVASAWGLLAALAELLSVPVIHASPQAVKLHATGKRTASKIEVQNALEARPGFEDLARQLEAASIPASLAEHPVDACAVALAALDTELGRAATCAARAA